MNKTFFATLIIVAGFSGTGCEVNPSKVDASYAKDFVSKATYVKDETKGLCYAVVGTRETMHTSQNGISWTWVPCEKAEKFLER